MIECEFTDKKDFLTSTKYKLLKITSNSPDPDLGLGVGLLIYLQKQNKKSIKLYLDQGKKRAPTESRHFF